MSSVRAKEYVSSKHLVDFRPASYFPLLIFSAESHFFGPADISEVESHQNTFMSSIQTRL